MFFFSGFKMSFAFFFSERALENPWSGEVSPAPGVLVDCAWFTRSPQAPSLPSGSDLPSQSCGWAGLGVGLAQTLASAMPAQVSSPGPARDPGDSKRVLSTGRLGCWRETWSDREAGKPLLR